jgi:XTP/dITP diphosphohydrolase
MLTNRQVPMRHVLVLATRNRNKIQELCELLTGLPLTIKQADEFVGMPDVVEDGETLEANALKKARETAAFTGEMSLADDTGLLVDALARAPGVYSSRYAGEGATYEDNCHKLLRELAAIGALRPEQRRARFETVVAIVDPRPVMPTVGPRPAPATVAVPPTVETPDPRPDTSSAGATCPSRARGGRPFELLARGAVAGEILLEARGHGGFGYDPIFLVPERGRTLAEMTVTEKNELSHRAMAVRGAWELLQRYLTGGRTPFDP